MTPACTGTRVKWQRKKKEKMARPCGSSFGSTSTTHQDIVMNTVEKLDNSEEDACSSGWSTPKAKRFRIPELLTCPPAPKKRRVTSNCSSNKIPIAFFASLDIELFFCSALRNNV
ncbi:hypothetical protein QN277_021081 [Acacia crassicarpa]|uniref:Uncharacterized protein n=1 Tax=Acacia crassicarpa TaxID=499986 RepID=A0AAE1KFU5_9FABA|nr:hypothetical protein QN277_021081 [Acacia crassicarpa]